MVAYSFKARFIGPIRAGLGIKHLNERGRIVIPGPTPKRQTIRAHGKRRHARPGETLQLYHAMRTKQCFKIGDARCVSVNDIEMIIRIRTLAISIGGFPCVNAAREEFARLDGFSCVEDMHQFWIANHPGVEHFEGVIIRWEPL